MSKDKSFQVFTISETTDSRYAHWAEGIEVVIIKNGVKLVLDSEEIQELVKALPRTVGGAY